jgi:spore maturation protein CgeB
MNLLILSPDYSKRVNWGHQHVRDALLAKIYLSAQYGEGCAYKGKTHIPDICEAMKVVIGYPEAILMENWKNMSKYTGGAEVDCLKVFMVCDYQDDGRGHIAKYNDLLNEHEIDLAICPTPDTMASVNNQKYKGNLSTSLRTTWIPHGANIDIFKPRGDDRPYDVMAVFGLVSYIYPNRSNVQKLIKNMVGVTSIIGDWKSNIKHYNYAYAISRSKIFVCANGIHNGVLMKYFEAMASGAMLLTNLPTNYKDFGFVPGVHFARWETLSDLEVRIRYYLEHDEQREKIAKAGMEFVRKYYSTRHVAIDIHGAINLQLEGRLPKVELGEKEKVSYETGIIGG